MSDIGMILDRIGRTLVTEVGPALEGHYAGGKAGLSGLMAVMAGEAWDGAADRLCREIDGMKALLAAGGDAEATEISPDSYKISDLSLARNELAERLIAMQAAIETDESAEAAALNTQIWGFLLATAAERMPSPPEFPDIED
ncbi:MAG: hypothetical protein AAFQ22_02815 [Pseudomonadota bacterium]